MLEKKKKTFFNLILKKEEGKLVSQTCYKNKRFRFYIYTGVLTWARCFILFRNLFRCRSNTRSLQNLKPACWRLRGLNSTSCVHSGGFSHQCPNGSPGSGKYSRKDRNLAELEKDINKHGIRPCPHLESQSWPPASRNPSRNQNLVRLIA